LPTELSTPPVTKMYLVFTQNEGTRLA